MFITVNDPILNRNLGKYQLPHIWDEVLQDMLALHLWCYHFHFSCPTWAPSPLIRGHTHHPWWVYSSQGCLSPSPYRYQTSHHILVPKIGKYYIFPQTWRNIVGSDITKACLFSSICILFCYNIGVKLIMKFHSFDHTIGFLFLPCWPLVY